jgi:hypothetical protein
LARDYTDRGYRLSRKDIFVRFEEVLVKTDTNSQKRLYICVEYGTIARIKAGKNREVAKVVYATEFYAEYGLCSISFKHFAPAKST